MAELASGAVDALLGVIRNEAQLLGGLENDVQFIKEEMESMNSFLQHLARTTPSGGEHNEQVLTWMKQVRELAYACNNCIDIYLQRGDPSAVRAARGRLDYLWRAIPLYMQKLYAQHRAATQLRELKDRARDVGERRLRYGVEIPTKTSPPPIPGATSPSQTQAAGGGDEGIISGDEARRAEAFREPRLLEECTQQLLHWLRDTEDHAKWLIGEKDQFPAYAIAAPDKDDGAEVASKALAHPLVAEKFKHTFRITPKFKSIFWYLKKKIEPLDILRHIQKDLLGEQEQKQGQEQKREKEIDMKIEEITQKIKDYLGAGKRSCTVVPLDPLDILHDILEEQLPNPKDILEEQPPKDILEEQLIGKDKMIIETAGKLKAHLEKGKEKSWIGLDLSEYEGILRELLPDHKEDRPVKEATDKSDDDQITNNIKEIMKKMKEDKSVKEATDDKMAENIKAAMQKIIVSVLRESLPKPKEGNSEKEDMEKLDKKIRGTLENIKELLLIREAVEKIKNHLKDKTTLIVLDGYNYEKTWENTKKALNMLECPTGSAVIVITKNQTEEAEKFCNPTEEAPILYSLVGFYHNKVSSITSQRKKEEQDHVLATCRKILKRCEPNEFCMKIFARALYVKPNRSKEELEKLLDTLVFRWHPRWDTNTNAREMLKFSYSDLPREYKTCLLYLAIFPRGHKIKRSSLLGRWVAEGLVTKEDWPSSSRHAERCFDELIDRCFVYPGDIGAAGKVKSCIVHDIVHEFITNIAKKEHFVETRMSHRHARHFSVLSDLRICSSDKIEKFLWTLHESPQLPLVKVLDLEGCDESFKMNQYHLKNICNKMLLLKYLSLRNIPIIKLPREINNLHQLEVLDIRQTHVDASTTKHLMLLKLKRLLASTSTTSTDNINRTKESFNAVRLPHGIGKMTNMEVLSHVKASEGAELKDIGKLWQLRKLGVVVQDKEAHLKNLVQVIGDLSESLQSLSISIKPLQDRSHGTPCKTGIVLRNPLNLLESLSIRGKTSGWLLPLLVKRCRQLAKVTLYNTSLNQDGLKQLGELPKLRCVRLQHESYTESNLTFKMKEFRMLKYLLVECSNLTDISFEDRAAPLLEKIELSSAEMTEMNDIRFGNGAATHLEKIVLSNIKITSIQFGEGAAAKIEEIVLSYTDITSITFKETPNYLRKIVLSFTNMEFLSTINNLPGMKEVELNGSRITSASLDSLFTKAERIAKVILCGTLLKQGDLEILAKQPNICCLMLLEKSCDEKQLIFNKDEFPKLNLLIVECSDISNISFTDGAAPNLEKIVWSFTEMESLSGINELPKLKELEFNGEVVPYEVTQDINAHPNNRLVFKHNEPQNEDKEKGSAEEKDDERRRFPFFWKKK